MLALPAVRAHLEEHIAGMQKARDTGRVGGRGRKADAMVVDDEEEDERPAEEKPKSKKPKMKVEQQPTQLPTVMYAFPKKALPINAFKMCFIPAVAFFTFPHTLPSLTLGFGFLSFPFLLAVCKL